MAKKFSDLFDFVDVAVKGRNYAENTAYGLRAALKLFDAELNDEERNSLDVFKSRVDRIYNTVFNKNSKKISPASLAIYKTRVMKVISDFEKYGTDAAKMANWAPKAPNRSKATNGSRERTKSGSVEDGVELHPEGSPNTHRVELALRPDAKCILVVPKNFTAAEFKTVKAILESLVQA